MAGKHPRTTSVVCSRYGFTFQTVYGGPRELCRFEVVHPGGIKVFTRKSTRHPFEAALNLFLDLVIEAACTYITPQREFYRTPVDTGPSALEDTLSAQEVK